MSLVLLRPKVMNSMHTDNDVGLTLLVLGFVFSQRSLVAKLFATRGTLERQACHVQLHVTGQVSLCEESLVTLVTLVWPLSETNKDYSGSTAQQTDKDTNSMKTSMHLEQTRIDLGGCIN